MYDLQEDPQEMTNIADHPDHAATRKKLEAELERLARQYQVPDDAGSVPRDPHRLIEALQGADGQ